MSAREQFRAVMLGAVILCAVLFVVVGAHVGASRLPPPHEDALIHYQYARSMAEGRPLRFNAGDEPTTGAPGLLYSALLAAFVSVGVDEAWLPTAGFVLSAMCFIGVVALTGLLAGRMEPGARSLAAGLVLLSGPTVYALFSQTDMSLFILLATAAFYAYCHERDAMLGGALVLASLCRPEGLLLSAALGGVGMLRLRNVAPRRWGPLLAALAGLATSCAVLALNFRLTSHVLPMAVLDEFFSGHSPFVLAASLGLAGETLAEVFFGLGEGPRRLLLLPVLGGALALAGGVMRGEGDGRRGEVALGWGAGAAVALLMVSIAPGKPADFDRALAWLFPFWLALAAVGVVRVSARAPWPGSKGALAVLLLGFQVLGLIHFCGELAQQSASMASNVRFLEGVRQKLTSRQRIGTATMPGMKFYLPSQEIRDISGVVDRDMPLNATPAERVEILRHEPDARFDFWLLKVPYVRGQWYSAFVGPGVDGEPPVFGVENALVLHRAGWGTLERADVPVTPEVINAVGTLELVDRVDVSYPPDESRSDYRNPDRFGVGRTAAFVETLEAGQRVITDAGRYSPDTESFRVEIDPNRDLLMVLRTSAFARLPSGAATKRFPLPMPVELEVSVDGDVAGALRLELSRRPVFEEWIIPLPASLLQGSRATIEVRGEHVAFGYWFYQ